MIDTLLQIVAPHHCYGCAKTGTPLCDNCKYNIISEPFSLCIVCAKSLSGNTGICTSCHVPYQRAWCVGRRQDELLKLIDAYKFYNAKACYRTLADLLDASLPQLPSTVIVVPVPTVSAHIRQRGYDHTLLIAKAFAKKRGLRLSTDLRRATNTKQRDAGYRLRIKQAKEAFTCEKTLSDNTTYLLLDDVVTTGATIKYASKALLDAGAGAVWVAAISRQTLD